jgi:Asp/Glu/hydantoin racemase
MRIGLIHAVQVAIDPINQAFAAAWPAAECMNILDDCLSVDRAKSADLTEEIYDRIGDLAVYAADGGADAILFTCSAFGAAIQAAGEAVDVPVLKPNEAMFDAALSAGNRIGMLVSFQPSVASMQQEFDDLVKARSSSATLEVICEPEAMAALRSGDAARHNALLAEAAKGLANCDAIMLGQFSTACAKPAVAAATGAPVLTSPDTAVQALKRLLS